MGLSEIYRTAGEVTITLLPTLQAEPEPGHRASVMGQRGDRSELLEFRRLVRLDRMEFRESGPERERRELGFSSNSRSTNSLLQSSVESRPNRIGTSMFTKRHWLGMTVGGFFVSESKVQIASVGLGTRARWVDGLGSTVLRRHQAHPRWLESRLRAPHGDCLGLCLCWRRRCRRPYAASR